VLDGAYHGVPDFTWEGEIWESYPSHNMQLQIAASTRWIQTDDFVFCQITCWTYYYYWYFV